MAKVLVTQSKLDTLSEIIGGKSNTEVPLTLDEMITAADSITSGGGTPTLQTKSETYTPTTSQQTDSITADAGYDGLDEVNVTVNAVPVVVPSVDGYGTYKTVSGVRKWDYTMYADSDGASGWYDGEGTYTNVNTFNAVASGTTITPTTSAQTIGGANYMMEGAVTVSAMPTGTAGTPTATKGAVSSHSVSVTPSVTNTTGYIAGSTINGTPVTVSASELVSGTYTVSASGTADVTNYASISVPSLTLPQYASNSSSGTFVNGLQGTTTVKYLNIPAGYNNTAQHYQISAAAGTAGTPTATKGAVSNHSVDVTPSVTNTTGYITGSTKTGTAVSVSASELVSGTLSVSTNGQQDVTNYQYVDVNVSGGGGGMTVATATATPVSASSSISFTGLGGEPTSFAVISSADLATGASPYKTAVVVFDGTNLHGQTITNTNNAQVSYDDTHFSKTYSNGTLTITGSTYWQANEYKLIYSYGGNSANIDTADVQVGSGATSITFTGLTDEPDYFSCIFKSNFATSSGYQRVIAVVYDGTGTYGLAMDSGAHAKSSWSYTYNNGTLTISSQGTNNGGYFHQPGYYQLTYGIGGTVEPTEIEVEPLSVTQNGTYTAPTGKAYSPVTVNVSGGSVNIDTKSVTNSSNQNTSISFSSMKGQPKAFFARCTSSLTRSSSNTYYYVADMVYDGTSTVGNVHARSNGQYSNVTSGYSWSYSGTTLTLTSSGARNTSPGSFYNGTYELVYVY